MIVIVWLMDDHWVHEKLTDGLSDLCLDVVDVTLMCSRDQLIRRWKADTLCEWRTDDWLNISLNSLPHFASLGHCVDTTDRTIEEVVDLIYP